MTDDQKNFLLEKTKEAIKESGSHLARTEGLLRAYQNASRSEEGDRAHAEDSFNLAKDKHSRLLAFLKEAETDQIKFVVTNLMEFYFANESVPVPGVSIIGQKSPLGQAIAGKNPGDKFELLGKEYQILSIS